jgi:hypothetical protein
MNYIRNIIFLQLLYVNQFLNYHNCCQGLDAELQYKTNKRKTLIKIIFIALSISINYAVIA